MVFLFERGEKMAEMHSFDVEIAKTYGVNCAVILQNLAYWIRHNEANEKNYFDGNYWTYNSIKAFSELFPYISKRQISTALQKLIDEKIIITGNYNKSAYDRTLWYALTEKGKSILHFCTMENIEMENGNVKNVEPIPDINTDLKFTNNKPFKIIVAYLNEKAGTAFKATSKNTQQHINARLSEGYTVDDFKTVIDKKCIDWIGTEWEQYLRPATLFGTKFENYLNAKSTKQQSAPKPQKLDSEKTEAELEYEKLFE
jgi:uncharacterized phage protein (TIGR02220 family)